MHVIVISNKQKYREVKTLISAVAHWSAALSLPAPFRCLVLFVAASAPQPLLAAATAAEMKYVEPLRFFTDLLKTTTKPPRLLGLDVGKVVVGLAISDQQNKLASPLNLLVCKNESTEEHTRKMAREFQLLASTRSIDGFVVAYPFGRQRLNRDAIRVEVLMDRLSKTELLEGIDYTYWNKRFSTTSMDVVVEHPDLHALDYEFILSRFSAVSTLQNYLEYMNEKQEAELKMRLQPQVE